MPNIPSQPSSSPNSTTPTHHVAGNVLTARRLPVASPILRAVAEARMLADLLRRVDAQVGERYSPPPTPPGEESEEEKETNTSGSGTLVADEEMELAPRAEERHVEKWSSGSGTVAEEVKEEAEEVERVHEEEDVRRERQDGLLVGVGSGVEMGGDDQRARDQQREAEHEEEDASEAESLQMVNESGYDGDTEPSTVARNWAMARRRRRRRRNMRPSYATVYLQSSQEIDDLDRLLEAAVLVGRS